MRVSTEARSSLLSLVCVRFSKVLRPDKVTGALVLPRPARALHRHAAGAAVGEREQMRDTPGLRRAAASRRHSAQCGGGVRVSLSGGCRFTFVVTLERVESSEQPRGPVSRPINHCRHGYRCNF